MFLPEIEEEDEDASGGTRTPKTSILSLHKVGLPSNQAGQASLGQAGGLLQSAGSSGSSQTKGHKPAEGIWR